MCDTIVALGSATADASVILAKNTDRHPNEAHELVLVPRATHPEATTVRCTYVDVPQVRETFATLLAKPFWIWGAEMGGNEHGVSIGNEAVFTRVPYEKGPGLTGMDLIRLALERSTTARVALDVIVNLLETYGQGGNCGFGSNFYYHNSFLIADPQQAWVLETAGRQWAAKQVKDVYSISNAITIGRDWDLSSEGLVEEAIERGWCKRRDEFDFSRCYSDPVYTRLSAARDRQRRATELLNSHKGRITVPTMMALLRDHGPKADSLWMPGRGLTGATICMHAAWGPIRTSQSVGSMVTHLTGGLQTHWLTGTSAPCASVFKPVWVDAGLPDLGPSPTGHFNADTLWWRHEALHRTVLRDYASRMADYRGERDALEARFIGGVSSLGGAKAERSHYSEQCFKEADDALMGWMAQVEAKPAKARSPFLYDRAWRGFNSQSNIQTNKSTMGDR